MKAIGRGAPSSSAARDEAPRTGVEEFRSTSPPRAAPWVGRWAPRPCLPRLPGWSSANRATGFSWCRSRLFAGLTRMARHGSVPSTGWGHAIRLGSGRWRPHSREGGFMEDVARQLRTGRRAIVPMFLVLGLGASTAGCTSSGGGSFASNDPGTTGTVVSGKSDTAGLSAGAVFMTPPTATKSP